MIDTLGAGGGAPAAGGGGGLDQAQAQMQAKIGQLRDLMQQVDSAMSDTPALAPIAQQMQTLIKTAVRELVKSAPQQTDSAMAIPTAGQ